MTSEVEVVVLSPSGVLFFLSTHLLLILTYSILILFPKLPYCKHPCLPPQCPLIKPLSSTPHKTHNTNLHTHSAAHPSSPTPNLTCTTTPVQVTIYELALSLFSPAWCLSSGSDQCSPSSPHIFNPKYL